jgi:hypothetical protein
MDQWRMLIYDIHGTPEHLAKLITILRNRHERNHENAWLLVCMLDGSAAYGGLTRIDLSQKFAPPLPVCWRVVAQCIVAHIACSVLRLRTPAARWQHAGEGDAAPGGGGRPGERAGKPRAADGSAMPLTGQCGACCT